MVRDPKKNIISNLSSGIEAVIIAKNGFGVDTVSKSKARNFKSEARSTNIAFTKKIQLKNMKKTGKVKMIINVKRAKSDITLTTPTIFEASRELSSEGLAMIIRRVIFLKNPNKGIETNNTEKNQFSGFQEFDDTTKIFMIAYDTRGRRVKKDLEKMRKDWEDVYQETSDGLMEISAEYDQSLGGYAQLKIE